MLWSKQNRLTWCLLDGSTSLRSEHMRQERRRSAAPISCLKKTFVDDFQDTNAARHMLCKLSVRSRFTYLNGLQGYQTISQSALAHRPGVTRAAWAQKSRAVDDEKAPPAFSHSRATRALQGQKTAHEQCRRELTASERGHSAAVPKGSTS